MNFWQKRRLEQISEWGVSATLRKRHEWLTKDLQATGESEWLRPSQRVAARQASIDESPLVRAVKARMASKVKAGPPKGKLAQAVRRRLLKDTVNHALKTRGALADLATMREARELAANVGVTVSDFTEVINNILADPGIEDKAAAIADLVGELGQIVQDQTGGK